MSITAPCDQRHLYNHSALYIGPICKITTAQLVVDIDGIIAHTFEATTQLAKDIMTHIARAL